MHIDSLERVTELQRQRAITLRMRDAARSGTVGDFSIWHEGGENKVFNVISAEPVRSAVIVACEDRLASIDKELGTLGVRVEQPFKEATRDIDNWRQSAEMFSRAWLRELGGKLLPKSHFIDALVLTTRQMRERAEKQPAA